MRVPASRGARLLLVGSGIVLLLLLTVAALPVSWAKSFAERRLAARFGAQATIGSLDRETAFSLAPVIRVSDIRVAQPHWAGPGDFASIGRLRLRLHILPLLVGRVDADLLSVERVRLNLVRDAGGRENWRDGKSGDGRAGAAQLGAMVLDDAQIRYVDARQRRTFILAARLAPATGLTINGSGTVDGAAVRVSAKGDPLTAARPWAFVGAIDGPELALHVAGTMARPLATEDMAFRVAARADDLKRIDRIIEAGLFGTQPVALQASVLHRDGVWDVQRLAGTIGGSPIDGAIVVRKIDGRTKLVGRVHFARLNFDDLASDAGLARGRLRERAQGLRLVPDTRINIGKIRNTDGRLTFAADRIVGGRRPSSIVSVRGLVDLDNRILTVAPLAIGLPRGTIAGRVVVDQRDDSPAPRVAIALDLRDSSLAALAGEDTRQQVSARVDGRVRLAGRGDTIREAVGNADGTIGLVALSGPMSDRLAGLIGFDLGRGLLGTRARTANLRCAILRLAVERGRGRVASLIVDTDVSQSRGHGVIAFPAETLDLSILGAPKGKALLRLDRPITIGGTIRAPEIIIPPSLKSAGTILKAIGRSLSGNDAPVASDADCDRLIADAIGTTRR